MKYVLAGDTAEFDYEVFGIFDSLNDLRQAATKILSNDTDLATEMQDQYGFSGLVCYQFNKLNSIGSDAKKSIDYDENTNQAILD